MKINLDMDYSFVILSGAKNPDAILKGIIYSGFFTPFRMTFIPYSKYQQGRIAI